MVLIPKADESLRWTDFIISADAMDVSRILPQEPELPDGLILSTLNDERVHHDQNRDKWLPQGLPETPQKASKHIEFVIHRQLEHILSTCSIPLKPKVIEIRRREDITSEAQAPQSQGNRNVPVALTCGDISFHRVSASSSL